MKMEDRHDIQLRELLAETARRERQSLKRATLFTAIPVLIGLGVIAISIYQIVQLESSKKTLSAEVTKLEDSHKALMTERDSISAELKDLQSRKTNVSEELKELESKLENAKERAREAEKALGESTETLENISQGKGNAQEQAQVALQNVQITSGGRWIVIGADKKLEGAQVEVQKAKKLGFANVAIYLRDNLYRTSIELPTEAEAKARLPEVRKRLNDGAYLRDLNQWCPKPQDRKTFFQCSIKN